MVSGLIQPDSGQWTLAHWQGILIARVAEALRTKPPVAQRFLARSAVEADRRFTAGAQYKDSTRHYYEVAHQEYLTRAAGRDPRAGGRGMSGTSYGVDPVRRKTRAMRPWDWSFPSRPMSHREVISAQPGDRHRAAAAAHGARHRARRLVLRRELGAGGRGRAGWPSYAVSLRGHGGSGGARHLRTTTTRDYVHDVMQTIIELPEPPVLIGHSMGAIVAQLVAERYPLRGLVLLTPAPMHSAVGDLVRDREGPAGRPRARGGRAARCRWSRTSSSRASTPRPRAPTPTAPRSESPLVQWELLLRRTVGPVRCPVLVIGTPSDRLVRPADVQRTAESYGVEPVWFPGIGHDVMLDAGLGPRARHRARVLRRPPGLGHGPRPMNADQDGSGVR